MFEIKYRIIEDFNEIQTITSTVFNSDWDQISGFFQICFGEHKEGSYYHNNPLTDDEEGDELLDYWFDKLLKVIILLDSSSDYVAVKEIETVNRWLTFKKQGDSILINVAIDDLCQNNNLLTTERSTFSYKKPLDFKVSYPYFKKQIVDAATVFLEELRHLNSELESTNMYITLNEKIKMIKS